MNWSFVRARVFANSHLIHDNDVPVAWCQHSSTIFARPVKAVNIPPMSDGFVGLNMSRYVFYLHIFLSRFCACPHPNCWSSLKPNGTAAMTSSFRVIEILAHPNTTHIRVQDRH
jgi:hypothetical protein